MERHPVPQHVSGYEFRLIGDMTLKQFGELAGGVILAFICWSLPIITLIKYPLAAFFAFLGVALAFIPVNEQPLDRWIINFFKAIYSPTQFIWKKSEVALAFMERPVSFRPPELPKIIPQADREKLKEYLRTIPAAPVSPLEKEIEERLQKISDFFGKPFEPPKIVPEEEKKVEKIEWKREVEIPEEKPPKREKVEKRVVKETEEPIEKPEEIKIPEFKRPPRPTIAPKFEPELPMPSRPTVPNILVGMVLDRKGKILPDIIIEIRNEKGFPVRALRANKLGQFSIATPLKNGTYEVELEKENYQFDIIKFEAKGKIIEPMEIRSKAKLT